MSGADTPSRAGQALAGIVALILPPVGLYLGGNSRIALAVNLGLLLGGLAVFFLIAAGPGLAITGLAWLHAVAVRPLASGAIGCFASVTGLVAVAVTAVLLLERPPLPPTEATQLALGGEVVRYNCQACHQVVGATRPNAIAPSLSRVIGRPVASEPYEYSEAMTNHGGIWTRERLLSFLVNPTGNVVGTNMAIGGISPEEAAAVIAYLSSFD